MTQHGMPYESLPRLNDVAQHIRLRFVPLQTRIFLTAVIIDLVSLVIVCALDQQLEGSRTVLSLPQGIAQDISRKLLAVHRHHLHARADPGACSWHPFNGVSYVAVLPQLQPDRVLGTDSSLLLFLSPDQFRARFVVYEFPAAALYTRERRPRSVVGKPFRPKAAPVVGSHLVQSIHHVVEGVSLDLRRPTLPPVEEVAKVVHGFLSMGLLADDGVHPEPVQH